jgi:zinc finger CCCH domain-containing protein 13
MPRSSRHRSHRSHRRGGSADRSESDGEESAPVAGAREEAAAARVSRDPEPERRRSSSGQEAVRSGNGYAEHGKKRKERVEEAVVDVVSDRWNSGVCDDHLVDKRSKSETFGHAEVEKLADRSRGSGDESKRSSRRAVAVDDRAEEVLSKSDSGKRRSEKQKDVGRKESTGHYKDNRDRENERERGEEWERQKERDRGRSRDREREKERAREKEREREREREKDRDRERDREHERERDRQKEREWDKKDHDSKHERYEDGGSRKSGLKMSRTEQEAYSYRRDTDVNGE